MPKKPKKSGFWKRLLKGIKMPLFPGKKNFGVNVQTELKAGKPLAQAKAIAAKKAAPQKTSAEVFKNATSKAISSELKKRAKK